EERTPALNAATRPAAHSVTPADEVSPANALTTRLLKSRLSTAPIYGRERMPPSRIGSWSQNASTNVSTSVSGKPASFHARGPIAGALGSRASALQAQSMNWKTINPVGRGAGTPRSAL